MDNVQLLHSVQWKTYKLLEIVFHSLHAWSNNIMYILTISCESPVAKLTSNFTFQWPRH